MFHLSRRAAGATVAGLAAAALIATSATAMAATTPPPNPNPHPTGTFTTHPVPTPTITLPTPTITPAFGYSPPPTPRPVLARERFIIVDTNADPAGNVNASGPIVFHNGTDTTNSATLDTLAQGARDIRVAHGQLPVPVVNDLFCTVTFSQDNAPWTIVGGTAADAGATGHGLYDLRGVFAFRDNLGGGCPLTGLNPFQIRHDIQSDPAALPTPVGWAIVVAGEGTAHA